MKSKIKKNMLLIVLVISIVATMVFAYLLYKKNEEIKLTSNNLYNSNFYELVNYIQNVETYLAKSTISTSSKQSAETLTYLWREANLAQTYLSALPIESQELENTEKFLNQVSDYSYTLSRKNIKGENLQDEELKNLQELHTYSIELENTLNELAVELDNGTITWKDLVKNGKEEFAQSVSTNLDIFSSLEENFHEYSGLIYDGAFSEHLTQSTPKAITGNEISEEEAIQKVKEFLGENNIKEIKNLGANENADIPAYNFNVTNNSDKNIYVAISKKGGHIVYSNYNRDIENETISYDEANKKAMAFLNEKGFKNMKETYYLNQSGILTINYAYEQEDVIIYPDLIKVKVALDNGEILGIETTGYLSNHEERILSKARLTMEEAKKNLNKNLNIQSETLAIIPTEYKTEILCYEFKGKIGDEEFMVYINANTGEEEDILVVYNTPNGVLTM